MIARQLALGVLVAAGSVGACQPRPSQVEGAALDTAAVVAALDSIRALYEEAVAARDFAAMAGVLADGAIMVGPGGPAWDSLRAASDGPWPPGATIAITPIEVRVLSDQWAYEFGTSVATYTPPGARRVRTLTDTYLVLFRRTPVGWKLYREVASPAAPPEPSPDR